MTTVHCNLEVVGYVDTFMLEKVHDSSLPFALKAIASTFCYYEQM